MAVVALLAGVQRYKHTSPHNTHTHTHTHTQRERERHINARTRTHMCLSKVTENVLIYCNEKFLLNLFVLADGDGYGMNSTLRRTYM